MRKHEKRLFLFQGSFIIQFLVIYLYLPITICASKTPDAPKNLNASGFQDFPKNENCFTFVYGMRTTGDFYGKHLKRLKKFFIWEISFNE